MKTIAAIFTIFSLGVFNYYTAYTSDNGKAGVTGSPGEFDCTNCHSGTTINAGGGSITVSSDIPQAGYTPGNTYNFSVTVNQPNITLFGIGAEILNTSNANCGTIVVTNTTQTSIKTSLGKSNLVHKLNGGLVTTAGSKTFSFQWKAPSTNTTTATIYVAGVAANKNGSDTGDKVYKTSVSYPLASTTSQSKNEMVSEIKLVTLNSNGDFNLLIPEKTAKASVQITSINGSVLNVFNNLTLGANKLEFPIGHLLPVGINFVTVTCDGETKNFKIIKSN